MKRTIFFLLIISIVLHFTGCVEQEPPEKEVKLYFEAFKSKDLEVLKQYADNPRLNALLNSKGDKKSLNRLYKYVIKNMSYRIVSIKAGEKDATIEVEITNVSFKGVLETYDKKSYDYVISNLYSGKVNKRDLDKKCLEIYVNEVKKAAQKKPTRKRTVKIQLKANDYLKWDLISSDELINAIIGGIRVPHQ